jgi:hypothetical protein
MKYLSHRCHRSADITPWFLKRTIAYISIARSLMAGQSYSTRTAAKQMHICLDAAAYLLAVSLEDGIVDFSRVGAIQVVPDVLQRLFPDPALDGGGLHRRLYMGEPPGQRVTGLGDKRFENLA